MTELLTAAQMREVEQAAINSGTVTGRELMERAGRGVVEAIFAHWPALAAAPHRAVVVCGPGNNGGDGFVVARLLKQAGWKVEVIFCGKADRLGPDARANHERLAGLVRPFETSAAVLSPPPDLLVDALFGIGMTRPLTGPLHDLVAEMSNVAMPFARVAVDLPSGLNADTGAIMGVTWPTELTVTFHRAKVGHFSRHGPELCGTVVVKDIGL